MSSFNLHNKGKKLRIGFIINPISGTKNKLNYDIKIKKFFIDSSIIPTIELTKKAGDATEIAKLYVSKPFDAIIVVGGDGTINEVVNGIGESGVPMGIVPSGSGNGIARHLGISMILRKALEIIKQGEVQPIDLLCINDKLSVNVSGLGFDALVAHKFQNIEKRGLVSYLKIIVSEFLAYKPQSYSLTIDGKEYNRDAFLISIANSSQFGNNAFISPSSSVSDGEMDICIVKPFLKIESPLVIEQLMTGRLDKGKYLEVIRAKEVVIKQESEIFHIDGDPFENGRSVNVRIIPSALNMIIPKRKINKI